MLVGSSTIVKLDSSNTSDPSSAIFTLIRKMTVPLEAIPAYVHMYQMTLIVRCDMIRHTNTKKRTFWVWKSRLGAKIC